MSRKDNRKSCHSDQKAPSKYMLSLQSRIGATQTKTDQITAKILETRRKVPGKVPGYARVFA
jgi:hypothetical protein